MARSHELSVGQDDPTETVQRSLRVREGGGSWDLKEEVKTRNSRKLRESSLPSAPAQQPQRPPSFPPPLAAPLTERVEKVRDFLDAAGDYFNVLPVSPVLVNLPLHRILLSRHGCRLRKNDCAGAPTP
ncbi:hypothetical protein P7K49_030760 [Saguinus oedipus]|uniref:Uncharacterized protein n=1 Tax=Saguinus oedipus TaxID=9490 RepID=A0ABQ9U3U1_SAGOE|nr:hypothetical protein P7K49_030760 [Saguinus oedipus]